MPVTLRTIAPQEIEAESFRMIEAELGPHGFNEDDFAVVRRVIHATGDFSFADNLRLSPGAVAHGIAALRQGRTILTDVTMAAAGISSSLLHRWGNRVVCNIADQAVREQAEAAGTTRAEAAMACGLGEEVGIVAIGNAPTALAAAIRILEQQVSAGRAAETLPLVVGVPVGFVNAAESKQLLAETELPHITSLGRKGGSPVAAAIVNALIRLAVR